MPRRAKVFMNNRSQAVRLPKDFQFDTDEVFIRKEGEDVILSPRPADWESYLVAAHARSLGVRLVTNNIAEFNRVKGLTLENWTTLPVRRVRATDDK